MVKKSTKKIDKRDTKGRFLKGHSIGRNKISDFEKDVKNKTREHLLECLAMMLIGRESVEKCLASKDVTLLEEMLFKKALKGDDGLFMKLLNKFVPDAKARDVDELDTSDKNVITLNYKID